MQPISTPQETDHSLQSVENNCVDLLVNNVNTVALSERLEHLASVVIPSAVYIETKESVNGTIKNNSGAGFFIEDGWIVTAAHVVENAHEIKISAITDLTTFEIKWETLLFDDAHDLAVFKSYMPPLNPLPLSNTALAIGQWICTVGNPTGLSGHFRVGIVSGFYPGNRHVQDRVIHLSLSSAGGGSGGPVVNLDGEVVGIIAGGIANLETFTYAVPVNFLKKMLDQIPAD